MPHVIHPNKQMSADNLRDTKTPPLLLPTSSPNPSFPGCEFWKEAGLGLLLVVALAVGSIIYLKCMVRTSRVSSLPLLVFIPPHYTYTTLQQGESISSVWPLDEVEEEDKKPDVEEPEEWCKKKAKQPAKILAAMKKKKLARASSTPGLLSSQGR